jgi:hypothetical protein
LRRWPFAPGAARDPRLLTLDRECDKAVIALGAILVGERTTAW